MDPSWVTAIATTVIALATFISGWIVHTANKRTEHAEKKLQQATERMNWLLGAIEKRRLAIAAKQAGIDIRGRDPTIAKAPKSQQHDTEYKISPLYIYLPKDQRAGEKKI